MTKQERLDSFDEMWASAAIGETWKLHDRIRSLISAHGGEAEQKRMVNRLDFDEWVDFLWHSLDRKDHSLLGRRLEYILSHLGFEIRERT